MNLKVLGCGDAFASEGRFNTSFLLESASQKLLIDCGASTLIRLKQDRIAVLDISTIVITHFHGDHYGGLPFFVIARYVEAGSKAPFTIVGPPGIKEKVYQLQEALYPGSSNMLDEIAVVFIEFDEKNWVAINEISIYSERVKHSPPANPHGIKISIEGYTIGFSGDTEWTDALKNLADGTNLFICECNNYENDSAGHLSYKTIMKNLNSLNSERIYLSHMSSEVLNAHEFELVRLADGMEFTL